MTTVLPATLPALDRDAAIDAYYTSHTEVRVHFMLRELLRGRTVYAVTDGLKRDDEETRPYHVEEIAGGASFTCDCCIPDCAHIGAVLIERVWQDFKRDWDEAHAHVTLPRPRRS